MIVIGVTGLARSGKDLFCKIAQDILNLNGFVVKKYAFADSLKRDVEPFLLEKCGVDVWTDDTLIKSDIRDFLVWYGTTFWRKRDPNKWIDKVDQAIKLEYSIDVALVSDVRYPNEGMWTHSKNGWLIHVSKYTERYSDGINKKIFLKAPNWEEETNDPLLNKMSNFKIEWLDFSDNGRNKVQISDIMNNTYFREKVFQSLKSCPHLSQKLVHM